MVGLQSLPIRLPINKERGRSPQAQPMQQLDTTVISTLSEVTVPHSSKAKRWHHHPSTTTSMRAPAAWCARVRLANRPTGRPSPRHWPAPPPVVCHVTGSLTMVHMHAHTCITHTSAHMSMAQTMSVRAGRAVVSFCSGAAVKQSRYAAVARGWHVAALPPMPA